MAKKEVKQVEEVEQHVTVDLTIDKNDPRNIPVVDGNDLPVVDINKPQK